MYNVYHIWWGTHVTHVMRTFWWRMTTYKHWLNANLIIYIHMFAYWLGDANIILHTFIGVCARRVEITVRQARTHIHAHTYARTRTHAGSEWYVHNNYRVKCSQCALIYELEWRIQRYGRTPAAQVYARICCIITDNASALSLLQTSRMGSVNSSFHATFQEAM